MDPLWFGTALMAAGVAVNLVATRRHTRVVAELNHGQLIGHGPSRPAAVLALSLGLVGIAMVIYLNVVN
jgi:predicted lysophospholipase L1 biosynthesis ABC-type transport system permease subunit